jgi:CheY-like chemotaxis protein
MSSTLLLVDDDEFFRSLAQEVLEQGGYAVKTAEDGQAAWEKMDKNPSRFDLVLLDKQMPRLDGISLLKRIRADARFKELPVDRCVNTSDGQQVMSTNKSPSPLVGEGLGRGVCNSGITKS